MPPKGKAKGKDKKKGKKKDDKKVLCAVDKQFYELYIADCNKKIAHAKNYLASLDDNNVEITETVRSLWEDKNDECGVLSKELKEKNDYIIEMNSQVIEIEIQLEFERKQNSWKIQDLNTKFKAMHDQLGSEIKMLNSKLTTLQDFYKNWDKLLQKFDDAQASLKQSEEDHKKALMELQVKRAEMHDAIRKDVEEKLLSVSEEFMHASEERNSGYTRRLIRENIALQKEIYLLLISQLKLKQQTKDAIERHNRMVNTIEALDLEKKRLIIQSQHRIELIERLTAYFENLKCHYLEDCKYPQLYEDLMAKKLCARFLLKQQQEQLYKLRLRVEHLKFNNQLQKAMNVKQDQKVTFFKQLVASLKDTIKASVTGRPDDTIKMKEMRLDINDSLVINLLRLTSRVDQDEAETPSIPSIVLSRSSLYRPGQLGLIPSHESFMDIFEMASEEKKVEKDEFLLKKELSRIIPRERIEKMAIHDVIKGSDLVYSSDREGPTTMHIEEEHYASEEQSGDYSDSSMSSDAPKKPKKKKTSGSGSDSSGGQSRITSAPSSIVQDKEDQVSSKEPSVIIDVGEVEEGGSDNDENEQTDHQMYGEEEEMFYYY